MTRIGRAALALVIAAALGASSGCASMSGEDRRFYALYLTDPHPTPVDAPHRPPGVMALGSVLLPGFGEFACGQVGWGIFWVTVGWITWPIGPPIAAYIDAETANKEWIAREYAPIYLAEQARAQQLRERERDEDHRAARAAAPNVIITPPAGN